MVVTNVINITSPRKQYWNKQHLSGNSVDNLVLNFITCINYVLHAVFTSKMSHNKLNTGTETLANTIHTQISVIHNIFWSAWVKLCIQSKIILIGINSLLLTVKHSFLLTLQVSWMKWYGEYMSVLLRTHFTDQCFREFILIN